MNWHPDIPSAITDAAGATWQVRRSWPDKAAGEYILEVHAAAGNDVQGVRAGHLRHGVFEEVPLADPRLPSLAEEASKGNVIVHRAHQRAVVQAGGQYIKVLRKRRATHVAERHTGATALAGGFFDTPQLLRASPDVVAFSSLAGRSFYELGQDRITLSDADFAVIWHGWARAWAAAVLASRSAAFRGVLDSLPLHPPEVQAVELRRWAGLWLAHSEGIADAGAARSGLQAQLAEALGRLLSSRPDPPGWAHGDLHDKQLLGTAGTGTPGLLDFDESCQAEAAMDLANLDVHLELRRRQHLLTAPRYRMAHGQILATAEALQVSPERFAAHVAGTRLRLACMYTFRPPWGTGAVRSLGSGAPALQNT